MAKSALTRRNAKQRTRPGWFPRPLTSGALAAVLLLVWVLVGQAAAGTQVGLLQGFKQCRDAIAKQERRHRIPRYLLSAIAMAETGRLDKDNGDFGPWPWSVYGDGRGRVYANKDQAIRDVKKLKNRGVKNIDVGCMQVNLMHHPLAFRNLDQAFDPTRNATYAAKLLRKLYSQRRSWRWAVARYHSATSKYFRPYLKRVIKFWRKERTRSYEIHRQRLKVRYIERKRRWAVRQQRLRNRRYRKYN